MPKQWTQGFAFTQGEIDRYQAWEARAYDALAKLVRDHPTPSGGGYTVTEFEGYPTTTAMRDFALNPSGVFRRAERSLDAVRGADWRNLAELDREGLLRSAAVTLHLTSVREANVQRMLRWTESLFASVKDGINLDKAASALWERAGVCAFNVPVFGNITIADIRSGLGSFDTIRAEFDKVDWEQVSAQVIASIAPADGVAASAARLVTEVDTTIKSVQSTLGLISGAGGLSSSLGLLSSALSAAMPYIMVALALIAVGEAIYDYFDTTDDESEGRKAATAEVTALEDAIVDILYAREQSSYVGTVKLRLREIAATGDYRSRWFDYTGNNPKGDLRWFPGSFAQEPKRRLYGAVIVAGDEAEYTPASHYTDPSAAQGAVWSNGDKIPRRGARAYFPDKDSPKHQRSRRKLQETRAATLRQVLAFLSQPNLTMEDRRTAFELLGLQLLQDASHFHIGLWPRLSPSAAAFPRTPLPTATGLTKPQPDLAPVRPTTNATLTTNRFAPTIAALSGKAITQIAERTPSTAYGDQALAALSSAFTEPARSVLLKRGAATTSLGARSFAIRSGSYTVPLVEAPTPTLLIPQWSPVQIVATLAFARGAWTIVGVSGSDRARDQYGNGLDAMLETVPLGGGVVDWSLRVSLCRFTTGHVSVAATRVIGAVMLAPEEWCLGPLNLDGSKRVGFSGAVTDLVWANSTLTPTIDGATREAVSSPKGREILQVLSPGSTLKPTELKGMLAKATSCVDPKGLYDAGQPPAFNLPASSTALGIGLAALAGYALLRRP